MQYTDILVVCRHTNFSGSLAMVTKRETKENFRLTAMLLDTLQQKSHFNKTFIPCDEDD